jgi:hypothetical protein
MHDLGSAQVPTARPPAVTQGSTRGLTEEGSFVEKHQDADRTRCGIRPGRSHTQQTTPTRSAAIHGSPPQATPVHSQSQATLVILTKEGSLVLPKPGSKSLCRQTTNVRAQGRRPLAPRSPAVRGRVHPGFNPSVLPKPDTPPRQPGLPPRRLSPWLQPWALVQANGTPFLQTMRFRIRSGRSHTQSCLKEEAPPEASRSAFPKSQSRTSSTSNRLKRNQPR